MSKTHKLIELHGFPVPACNATLSDFSYLEWRMVSRDKSVTCKRCMRIMEKKDDN